MPRRQPDDPQLVLPLTLRVGDVIEDGGERFEVIERPVSLSAGKLTRAKLRRVGDGAYVRDAVWEAWRKVRRVSAAG